MIHKVGVALGEECQAEDVAAVNEREKVLNNGLELEMPANSVGD